jgi:hypothetical protein
MSEIEIVKLLIGWSIGMGLGLLFITWWERR